MAAAVNHVGFSVVVHVITDNRKSGLAEFPVSVPVPLVLIGVDIPEPAKRRQEVVFAVAIDVRDPDAMAVLLRSAGFVDFRLRARKIDPNHAGSSVVTEG